MDVPRERLGLDGAGRADILDVKIDDPFLRDDLLRRPGFLPGYHLSRRTWTAVLLDGTVPLSEVCALLDASWRAAAGRPHAAFHIPPSGRCGKKQIGSVKRKNGSGGSFFRAESSSP